MALGRKRKKAEKPRESNAGAEPEAEQGLEALKNHKEDWRRVGGVGRRAKSRVSGILGCIKVGFLSCERETQKCGQEGQL
jgi:hypothetical protein